MTLAHCGRRNIGSHVHVTPREAGTETEGKRMIGGDLCDEERGEGAGLSRASLWTVMSVILGGDGRSGIEEEEPQITVWLPESWPAPRRTSEQRLPVGGSPRWAERARP